MDWHLLEVGLVTTLALWVYLFSPTQGSRAVAMVVFWINVLWVLFERDPADRKPDVLQRPPGPASRELPPEGASEAAQEDQERPAEGGQPTAAGRQGTRGRVI